MKYVFSAQKPHACIFGDSFWASFVSFQVTTPGSGQVLIKYVWRLVCKSLCFSSSLRQRRLSKKLCWQMTSNHCTGESTLPLNLITDLLGRLQITRKPHHFRYLIFGCRSLDIWLSTVEIWCWVICIWFQARCLYSVFINYQPNLNTFHSRI